MSISGRGRKTKLYISHCIRCRPLGFGFNPLISDGEYKAKQNNRIYISISVILQFHLRMWLRLRFISFRFRLDFIYFDYRQAQGTTSQREVIHFFLFPFCVGWHWCCAAVTKPQSKHPGHLFIHTYNDGEVDRLLQTHIA